MNSKIKFSLVISLLLGLMVSFSTLAKQELPQVTEEGLHLLQDTDLAVVYAKPGVDLGVYNRILLLDATVAFKKNWQRDQNRSYSHKVDARDMDRIRTRLAELFREVFTEKLSAAGYELAGETADDVLIVRPAIINLDVLAPDVRTTSRSYQLTQSAGEMSLYLELYDSVTSDLLGKAMDRKRDRDSGFMKWQTRGANKVAASRALNGWADVLVAALNNARGTISGEAESE